MLRGARRAAAEAAAGGVVKGAREEGATVLQAAMQVSPPCLRPRLIRKYVMSLSLSLSLSIYLSQSFIFLTPYVFMYVEFNSQSLFSGLKTFESFR